MFLQNCTSLVLSLILRLKELLETETRPEMIELLLLCVSNAARVTHLVELPEEDQDAVEWMVEHLKRTIKSQYGTPKCAKYTIVILSSFLPSEDRMRVRHLVQLVQWSDLFLTVS